MIDDVKAATWPADHYLRNNIAFGNNQNLAHANQSLIDDEANSWNAGFSASTPDSRSILSAGVEGLRQADGSLPNLDF